MNISPESICIYYENECKYILKIRIVDIYLALLSLA